MYFWIADLALGTSRPDPDRERPVSKPKRKARAVSRVPGQWRRVRGWIREWIGRRQSIHEMERLSDHLLADAGLSREDVHDMRYGAYRPFPPEQPFLPPRRAVRPEPAPRRQPVEAESWREAA